MANEYAAHVNRIPDVAHGVPVGPGMPNARFSIEMLLPVHPDSTVGTARVGRSRIGGNDYQWADLTPFVLGTSIERGAPHFGGEPETGVMELTLRSDAHRLSPWVETEDSWNRAAEWLRPNVLIRAGVRDGSTWHPLFCGEVERWTSTTTEFDAFPSSSITIVETWARLVGETIENYNPTVDGGGQAQVKPNVEAVLAASRWPYGSRLEVDTRSFGNTLNTEIYAHPAWSGDVTEYLRTIARSIGRVVRTDARGRIEMRWARPNTVIENIAAGPGGDGNFPLYPESAEPGGLGTQLIVDSDDYVADQIVISSSSDAIVNSITYNVNDTLLNEFTDAISIRRYGLHHLDIEAFFRDGNQVRQAEEIIASRAGLLTRIESLTLDQRRIDLCVGVDLDAAVRIDHRPRTAAAGARFTGWVRSIRHDIRNTLGENELRWTTTYGVDTYTKETLP